MNVPIEPIGHPFNHLLVDDRSIEVVNATIPECLEIVSRKPAKRFENSICRGFSLPLSRRLQMSESGRPAAIATGRKRDKIPKADVPEANYRPVTDLSRFRNRTLKSAKADLVDPASSYAAIGSRG